MQDRTMVGRRRVYGQAGLSFMIGETCTIM